MTGRAASPGSGRAAFLGAFLRAPLTTASAVPTSAALARLAASVVPLTGDPLVVELGAGTGPITAAVQERLGGRGRHVAVELDGRLADVLTARHPGVEVVRDDATRLRRILDGERADVVLSALPWAAYQAAGSLHDELAAAVPPDGVVVQLAYTVTLRAPQARWQLAELRRRFEEVLLTRTVWANLPPALLQVARRPLAGATVPPPPAATTVRRR